MARCEWRGDLNKSAPIRLQFRPVSAKEVVAKAGERGVKISEHVVHTARSNAKEAEAKRDSDSPRKPSTKSEEATFRGLVVAIGTGRATELLAEVEAKLAAVIAGR